MAFMKEMADDESTAILFNIAFRESSSSAGEVLLDLIH